MANISTALVPMSGQIWLLGSPAIFRGMVQDSRLRYQLLTGPDTSAFCQRVSDKLDDGYVLYGSPSLTFDGTTTYVAQAVILAEVPAGESASIASGSES